MTPSTKRNFLTGKIPSVHAHFSIPQELLQKFWNDKNLCTPMFIAAQFTIAKYWKQPKCPSANEWIKKL